MTLTRRRVIDVVGATSGVMVLLLALAIIDHRIRQGLTSGAADLAAVGEDVNYLALGVALMVAEFVRGELFEHVHLLVFTATAVALVIFLMRL